MFFFSFSIEESSFDGNNDFVVDSSSNDNSYPFEFENNYACIGFCIIIYLVFPDDSFDITLVTYLGFVITGFLHL